MEQRRLPETEDKQNKKISNEDNQSNEIVEIIF